MMAQDMVNVMQALGFDSFYLCGHDRGGRVAHRLALGPSDRSDGGAFYSGASAGGVAGGDEGIFCLRLDFYVLHAPSQH